MLKGTLILVLAYVAAVYCAAVPENASPEYNNDGECGYIGPHEICA